MARDGAVVADIAARGAAEVGTEAAETGVELLEHNGLGLNFADLLGNDAEEIKYICKS